MPRPTPTPNLIDESVSVARWRDSLAATRENWIGGGGHGVIVISIALTGAASPKLMPAELSWQWRVFDCPSSSQSRRAAASLVVGDGADPMGWSAGYPVIGARLDHGHDTASGRARSAGEWSEHARGGDEHGVWTASDGGA